MQHAIRVDELHVAYRGRGGKRVEAVNGLSFRVAPGEVVGFLGPNGAGKSSTLKALMGFVSPAKGQAFVFGEIAGSVAARTRSGYLPEVALYYPFLSPLETLHLYGELQGIEPVELQREAAELLEVVGIAPSAAQAEPLPQQGNAAEIGNRTGATRLAGASHPRRDDERARPTGTEGAERIAQGKARPGMHDVLFEP